MLFLGRSVEERASPLLWHTHVSDPGGLTASCKLPPPSCLQGLSREEHLSTGWWEPAAVTWLGEGTHCSALTQHCKHQGRARIRRRANTQNAHRTDS